MAWEFDENILAVDMIVICIDNIRNHLIGYIWGSNLNASNVRFLPTENRFQS